MHQEVRVQPWPEEQPPTEASIRKKMEQEGLQPYRWSNGPGDIYAVHSHPYYKVIYVLQGSITFGLPDAGKQVLINAGDRLDLPPEVSHNAWVGGQGVVCLEAHRP